MKVIAEIKKSMWETYKNMKHKKLAFGLFMVFSLGLALRLYGATVQNFWGDELYVLRVASSKGLLVLFRSILMDPPGYFLLIHYFGQILGISFYDQCLGAPEFAVRLPSIILGASSLVAIFFVGKQMYSFKEGLIASVLMAVSYRHIYYSQESRPYAMLIFFVLLAVYLWIKLLKRFNTNEQFGWRLVLGYIIISFLVMYSHYSGVLFIALQGLAAIIYSLRKRKSLGAVLLVYFIIMALYLPWVPFLWRQIHLYSGTMSFIRSPGTFLAVLRQYIEFLLTNYWLFTFSIKIIFCLASLRWLYEVAFSKRQRNVLHTVMPVDILVLVMWIVIPLFVLFVISRLVTPVLMFRYLLISLPATYLLIARFITKMSGKATIQIFVTVFLAAVFLFVLISKEQYYLRPVKEQFREAANFIVLKNKAYENSTIVGYDWSQEYFDYYFTKQGLNKKIEFNVRRVEDIPVFIDAFKAQKREYVWYVYNEHRPNEKFLNFLNKTFSLIEHHKLFLVDVWLFRVRESAGVTK